MPVTIIRYEDPIWRQPSAQYTPGTHEPPLLQGEDAALAPPTGCLLLAYDPDTPHKILGSAGFVRVTDEICEARRVVVHWDYQHKGIGKQLLAALLNEAKNAGYTGIRTQIPANLPALATFFEHAGFHRSPEEFQTPTQLRLERQLQQNP